MPAAEIKESYRRKTQSEAIMTDVNLTPGEVAQVHLRLYRIQKASKEGRATYIFNQARLLLLLVQKAERRELKAIHKKD